VDRVVLAALPLSDADFLESHGNRLAIRHRFHCHAMSRKINRMVVAALACCIPLIASLNVASASEHRSPEVKHEFQWRHPCPSTGRPTGACPGYVKDHIVPLACGGPDSVANLQWQTVAEAKAKDKWETKGCRR
jgi:hypothetical protein